MLDNNESYEEVKKRILSRQDLKSEINQYVVVDPHFRYKFPKWKMGEHPKWNFKEDVDGMYSSPIKNIFVNPDLGREGLHSMKRATLNSFWFVPLLDPLLDAHDFLCNRPVNLHPLFLKIGHPAF